MPGKTPQGRRDTQEAPLPIEQVPLTGCRYCLRELRRPCMVSMTFRFQGPVTVLEAHHTVTGATVRVQADHTLPYPARCAALETAALHLLAST